MDRGEKLQIRYEYVKKHYGIKTLKEMASDLGIAQGTISKYIRIYNIQKNKKCDPKCWDIGVEGITIATISMCIKEDFDQTLEELAQRLSSEKAEPYDKCLQVLNELQSQDRLGFYDDNYKLKKWR